MDKIAPEDLWDVFKSVIADGNSYNFQIGIFLYNFMQIYVFLTPPFSVFFSSCAESPISMQTDEFTLFSTSSFNIWMKMLRECLSNVQKRFD